MNLNYLIDPNMQFQDRNGVNNVAGFLRVYYEGTDDRATTYKDFNGTMNPADIPLDNNGRAVVIADSDKEYRVEVYSASGAMLWTQHPLFVQGGGGGGSYDGDVSDATATFTKDEDDTSEIASGSTLKVLFTKISKFFASLKRVAFTGSYNDLEDTPTIPAAQVQSDWNEADNTKADYIKNKPNLASVATSGDYADLDNKPTIPNAQVNSDWNANSGVAKILNKPLPANIFNAYGPWTEQLTAADVSNGYKDFTNILRYGVYPNIQNFTFVTNYAFVSVSLENFKGLVGQTALPATYFTFEVYAGYESNPTKILIRSVTKTGLTDTDDRGVPIQDLQFEPVWNCTLLGSQFLSVCDRITVRVKWKNSSFGSTSNRIKASFTVAVMNPSGMTEWPQE